MPEHLSELWRADVPGEVANVFLSNPASGSLFVGDGWGVAYPALRLHRLSLSTGEELAQVRTRHQQVMAMTMHMGHLYAACFTRLFELDATSLHVRRQWDRGLVRYTWQLASLDSRLVAANWLAPTIGIFDPATGRTKRLRVGAQPLIVDRGHQLRVIAGCDGGMWGLDAAGKLTAHTKTRPVAHAASGQHIWAVLSGPAEGGGRQSKKGTDILIRLTGDPWEARLGGPCSRLACDDQRGLVWCVVGDHRNQLQAVSQTTGAIVASLVIPGNQVFCHVDALAEIALTMEPHRAAPTNGSASLSGPFTVRLYDNHTSTVVCYSLRTIART